MDSQLIKALSPFLLAPVLILFCSRHRNGHVRIALAYVYGLVALSSNYVMVFREAHQVLHLCVATLGYLALFRQAQRIPTFNKGLLAFLALIVLSITLGGTLDVDAKSSTLNFVLILGAVNYFYIYCWKEGRLDIVIRFLALISGVAAVLGIIEFLATGTARIELTSSNSNYFGYLLGVGFCCALHSYRGLKGLALAATIFAALVLTGSRASLIFPVLSVFFVVLSRRRNRALVVLCGAVLVTIVATVLLRYSDVRLADTANQAGGDFERQLFAQTALMMANDHPLFGVGWGRFPSEFSNYSRYLPIIDSVHGAIDVSQQERRVTHNDLLRIMAELGFPALCAALLACIVGAYKVLRRPTIALPLLAPLWISNVAFSMTHNNLNSSLCWIIFLMAFVYVRRRNTQLIN